MPIKFIVRHLNSSTSAAQNDSVSAEYVFNGSLFTIGSDVSNKIVLPESASEQAVVVQEAEQLMFINGSEGTIFNGRNLRREAIETLAAGDEIVIGKYVISVVSTETAVGSIQDKPAFQTNPAAKEFPAEQVVQTSANHGDAKYREQQNGRTELSAQKPARNFADVLNTLRTEEDSFYFIVKNGTAEEKRILLEKTEMPLGFDANGEICCADEQIISLIAIVQKDWSGIVVEAQRGGAVSVNDELIKTARRLRNGDLVSFNAPRKSGRKIASLELHEPSSLVALESLLETRARNENVQKSLNGANNLTAGGEALTAEQPVPIFERNFFGYFSFFEVVAMAIATLIGGVLIFLLFEFAVS